MRTKDEIMDYIGMTKEYNPHGGQTLDIKEIALIEVLIDIRDSISEQAAKFGIIETIFAKLHEAGIDLH